MRRTFRPIKDILKDVRSGRLLQKSISEFLTSLPDKPNVPSDARAVGMTEKITGRFSSKHPNMSNTEKVKGEHPNLITIDEIDLEEGGN